jgi:hypothetical protein
MTPELHALVGANDDFALDLYPRLAGEGPGQNLFFSPNSIFGALALAVEGARGETAEQMGKALRYPDALRRKGDAMLPWGTDRIHAGMAALNDHFTSGSKAPPKEIRTRLDALREELKAVNRRAAALGRARDWQAQEAAAMQSQKIAAELNRLQVRYSQYELRIANALWGEKSYDFRRPISTPSASTTLPAASSSSISVTISRAPAGGSTPGWKGRRASVSRT